MAYTSIYESPMNDNGYDISNYLQINEQFGTIDDFKRLVDEAHHRGLNHIRYCHQSYIHRTQVV